MAAFDDNIHSNEYEEEFDAATARILQSEADSHLFRGLVFDERLRAAVLERVAGDEVSPPSGRRRWAWVTALAGSGAAAAVLAVVLIGGRHTPDARPAVRQVAASQAESLKAVAHYAKPDTDRSADSGTASVAAPRLSPATGAAGGAAASQSPLSTVRAETAAAADTAKMADTAKTPAVAPYRYGTVIVGLDARARGVKFTVEKVDFTDRDTQVHFIITDAEPPVSLTLRLSRDGAPPEGALEIRYQQQGNLLLGKAFFNPTPRETRLLHVEMAGFHGKVAGVSLDADDVWPVELRLPESEQGTN